MIFGKCEMSCISLSLTLLLTVISLTEGLSYGRDECPEENRNRFINKIPDFHLKIGMLTKTIISEKNCNLDFEERSF